MFGSQVQPLFYEKLLPTSLNLWLDESNRTPLRLGSCGYKLPWCPGISCSLYIHINRILRALFQKVCYSSLLQETWPYSNTLKISLGILLACGINCKWYFSSIIECTKALGYARLYGPRSRALFNPGHHSKQEELYLIWYIDQNVITKGNICCLWNEKSGISHGLYFFLHSEDCPEAMSHCVLQATGLLRTSLKW